MTVAMLALMAAVGSQAIDPNGVPTMGTTAKDFVPAGWVLEQQVQGSLTGSAAPDTVLVLGDGTSSARVLLILTRTEDRRLRRAALASKLLACSGCRSAPAVRIVGNVLNVSNGRLSFHFRYEPESKEFLLIGEDFTNPGPFNPGRVSSNFLTGTQVVQTREFDANTRKTMTVANPPRTIDKLRLTIEAVDWNGDVDVRSKEASRALSDPDPQSGRVPVGAGRGQVRVPKILLARLKKDLGGDFDGTLDDLTSEISASKVQLADPKATPTDRVLPADAEFYWLTGPRLWCGSAGCGHHLYWASLATGDSGALIRAGDPKIETFNATLRILRTSSKGLFDVEVWGDRLRFDGQAYLRADR